MCELVSDGALDDICIMWMRFRKEKWIRLSAGSTSGTKTPLGDPPTKAHIVLLWEDHTVRPYPLIDALGKSNIYRNVMPWQPSIKHVITKPIQKRDRKEGMLGMMSARRGGEGARQRVNSCSRIVCGPAGYQTYRVFVVFIRITTGRNSTLVNVRPLVLKDYYTAEDCRTATCPYL